MSAVSWSGTRAYDGRLLPRSSSMEGNICFVLRMVFGWYCYIIEPSEVFIIIEFIAGQSKKKKKTV